MTNKERIHYDRGTLDYSISYILFYIEHLDITDLQRIIMTCEDELENKIKSEIDNTGDE